MDKEKNTRAYLALFSIYIIWGTTYLAIRIGVENLPPVLFTGLRWIVAGPLLLIILLLKKYKLPNKNDLLHLSISGLLLLGGGNGLVVFAEQWVPSGLTALLITTVPFWVVGIDAIIPQGKKINPTILLGLLLGLVGVGIIFGGDFVRLFDPSYLSGIIGLMFAVVLWSVGTLYSKYKKISVHPLMGAATQMIIAGIVITALGLILGEGSKFHFTNSSFYSYLYLVIVGSLVGYGSYVYAIAHLPVSLVATYAYVNPVIALFLGWLILDEKISLWVILAAVVILIGVTLVKKGSEKNILFRKKS
ncbi:MAG: EamA family transporter [Ignavibacteriales bacterium]|nr:EamA family transporter [Ignavibacteriales bacterium]